MAEETHIFDPALSLTGNCSESTVDPVPDPGCPGGAHPPSGAFASPLSVTTDDYGDIYVAVSKKNAIDVFDADGVFLTSLSTPVPPLDVAVDSGGNLYVANEPSAPKIVRYSPTVYQPETGTVAYGNSPVIVEESSFAIIVALAVNPSNDHLFAHLDSRVVEYGNASEANVPLDDEVGSVISGGGGQGLAIDAARGFLYATSLSQAGFEGVQEVRVFELASPHAQLGTIRGSDTPAGKWIGGLLSIAVDEGSGRLFVLDGTGSSSPVHVFEPDGSYVTAIDRGFKYAYKSQIAIDNGVHSPNGEENPFGRYLFVPSHPSGTGHVFAMAPKPVPKPPIVETASVGGITEDEALAQAKIDPKGAVTAYRFEYVTQQHYEVEGFSAATLVRESSLSTSNEAESVSAVLSGLTAGTAYRVRVVATSPEGESEREVEFSTYAAPEVSPDCPNQAQRTDLSALLPDCRAYELVTPADTNGHAPIGLDHLGSYFPTRQASPDGERVSFLILGGTIPGFAGTGSFGGDPYLATRGREGWATASAGPSGSESPAILPGSMSPDQSYSVWETGSLEGPAAIEGKSTSYLRYPDGHSEPLGSGAIATDPQAIPKLISENGEHVVFVTRNSPVSTSVRIEEEAPPNGTTAIYDKGPTGLNHVVSLLPGDLTPAAGKDATYKGASLDGRGVAFSIGSTLYLRRDNAESFEIGDGIEAMGVSEGGRRIFYMEGGDLLAFDADTASTTPFTSSGDATVVNVSPDGTTAYFVSPTALASAPNPEGDLPQVGDENLYRSHEGAITFVGVVTQRDVEGELRNEWVGGLGLWSEAVQDGRFGVDPSRVTPDGSVLLFESRASLVGHDTQGHAQVYRYDVADDTLRCLSCLPTGASSAGEASLQSISDGYGLPQPLNAYDYVTNLRSDGKRAFFESTEPLVVSDRDGMRDVYEWEEEGVGSCSAPGGCTRLLSSAASGRPTYLFAASDSGDDVFFSTSDLLLPDLDRDETSSIYDARVGGGFVPTSASVGECLGEACQPTTNAPGNLTPASSTFVGQGNARKASPKPRKRCPQGKRRVQRKGQVRCRPRPHRKKHRGQAAARGARR